MMSTMTYTLKSPSIDDRISHLVRIPVGSGEPMTTVTNWLGEKYRFQPSQLTIRWDWNWQTDSWELIKLYVRGMRLNKDGKVNARGLVGGRDLLVGNVVSSEAPGQFVELIGEHYPSWSVVS